MIPFPGRVLCLIALVFVGGCSGNQPATGTATSIEELAAYIDENPSLAEEASLVPLPATTDPQEKETLDTLDLGN